MHVFYKVLISIIVTIVIVLPRVYLEDVMLYFQMCSR